MKLSIHQIVGNTVSVHIEGRITRLTQGSLDPLAEILGPNYCEWNVLLDMSDVEYIDSGGIGWLMHCRKDLQKSGGRLVLFAPSPTTHKTLKLLNLDTIFDVVDDEEQALAIVQGDPDGEPSS